jgi:hypothetical protein
MCNYIQLHNDASRGGVRGDTAERFGGGLESIIPERNAIWPPERHDIAATCLDDIELQRVRIIGGRADFLAPIAADGHRRKEHDASDRLHLRALQSERHGVVYRIMPLRRPPANAGVRYHKRGLVGMSMTPAAVALCCCVLLGCTRTLLPSDGSYRMRSAAHASDAQAGAPESEHAPSEESVPLATSHDPGVEPLATPRPRDRYIRRDERAADNRR